MVIVSPLSRIAGPLPNGRFTAYKWGWSSPLTSALMILIPSKKPWSVETMSKTCLTASWDDFQPASFAGWWSRTMDKNSCVCISGRLPKHCPANSSKDRHHTSFDDGIQVPKSQSVNALTPCEVWILFCWRMMILLMAEIFHQLIASLSHYLQGFIHPRWCRISAINSREINLFLWCCVGCLITCFSKTWWVLEVFTPFWWSGGGLKMVINRAHEHIFPCPRSRPFPCVKMLIS